jgi:lipoprotein-anchoring transpeptidase ErfK/SrfK
LIAGGHRSARPARDGPSSATATFASRRGLYNEQLKTHHPSIVRGCRGAIMKWLSGRRQGTPTFAVLAFAVLSIISAPARADVVVQIDKSSQRMAVSVDGTMRYNWPVSTGRSGYGTPSGVFHPQSMARHYFSRKYYNAPMPHAIFFYYGFAIHGTNDLARLGGPASHGCVRLHPSHAAALFALVERQGPRNTRIEISN